MGLAAYGLKPVGTGPFKITEHELGGRVVLEKNENYWDPERPALDCPNDRDGDGDGLLDCEESFLKSNPLLPDTDADGVTLRITDLGGAERVALTVPRADSTRTVVFTAPTADDLGELVGVVARDSLVADAPIMVELRLADELLQVARADAAGTFRFEGLPEGEYQLRLIADRDTSGTWTGGTLAPYTPPEALLLVPTPERVRPRWETVIDTLRFGTPPRPVLPTTPAADAAPPETGDG